MMMVNNKGETKGINFTSTTMTGNEGIPVVGKPSMKGDDSTTEDFQLKDETKSLKLVRVLEELDPAKEGTMDSSYLIFMTDGGMVGTQCQHRLQDKQNRISRNHFKIIYEKNNFFLMDNKSTNGLSFKIQNE
jgi:FHA domain